MASTIAAITTGIGGIVTTADATGNLSLLSGTSTVVAVTSAGAAVTGTMSVSGATTLTGGLNTPLAVTSGGTGVATSTGSGAGVHATSPTLTTPTISTITSAAATALTLQSASTTAVTIDTSQNVGIGTTSPATKLQVQSSGDTITTVKSTSGTNGASLIQLQGSDSSTYSAYNAIKSLNSDSSQQWYIGGNGAANTITFQTSTSEQMRIDSAGLLKFNSGYGSAATAYGCRAWVNFNGTGTVAIRASGNVSSITDNGTGYYTVNFTTSIVDANYSASTQCNLSASWGYVAFERGTKATGNYTIQTAIYNATTTDADQISVSIFR